GADILVHSVDDPIDEDFITLMRQNEVTYIPTLQVHGNYIEMLRDSIAFSAADFNLSNPIPLASFLDTKRLPTKNDYQKSKQYLPYMTRELLEQEKIRANNLKQLAAAGIPIATGTDAGNIKTLHASSYYEELDYMQKAGLTNIEILRASTKTAAQLLNTNAPLGEIKVGNIADLVVLKSNALKDLAALKDIAYVIKDGQLFHPDSILIPTSEQLAQQQLNGYNARDIDAFLAPYADDVEIYRFPDELQYTGKEKMRNNYGNMFAKYPDLYCNLVNRIVQGDTVIDQELVTRGGKQMEAIAIYKIADGKIKQVYFVY
ncbi:MAG: nuclear transport factor 2 family protein, partial [Saprospiraceae bacterium]